MINIRTLKRLFPECTIEKEIAVGLDKELGIIPYDIKGEHEENIKEKLSTVLEDYEFTTEKLYRHNHCRIYLIP